VHVIDPSSGIEEGAKSTTSAGIDPAGTTVLLHRPHPLRNICANPVRGHLAGGAVRAACSDFQSPATPDAAERYLDKVIAYHKAQSR